MRPERPPRSEASEGHRNLHDVGRVSNDLKLPVMHCMQPSRYTSWGSLCCVWGVGMVGKNPSESLQQPAFAVPVCRHRHSFNQHPPGSGGSQRGDLAFRVSFLQVRVVAVWAGSCMAYDRDCLCLHLQVRLLHCPPKARPHHQPVQLPLQPHLWSIDRLDLGRELCGVPSTNCVKVEKGGLRMYSVLFNC